MPLRRRKKQYDGWGCEECGIITCKVDTSIRTCLSALFCLIEDNGLRYSYSVILCFPSYVFKSFQDPHIYCELLLPKSQRQFYTRSYPHANPKTITQAYHHINIPSIFIPCTALNLPLLDPHYAPRFICPLSLSQLATETDFSHSS